MRGTEAPQEQLTGKVKVCTSNAKEFYSNLSEGLFIIPYKSMRNVVC